MAPALWYLTGAADIIVLAVLYFAWWAWTIPQHYHYMTGVAKTHEWASKTSRSLIIAVPGLAIIFLSLCGMGYKAIGFVLTALGISINWFTADIVQELMPYLLSLPVVTAAVLWHMTIMFSRMIVPEPEQQ